MASLSYQPLRGGEIRLLKPRGAPNLSFDFVHADLDKHPEYAALSYTWGDPVFPCTVNINGHAKQITQNLFDALSVLVPRMRKPNLGSSLPKLIWVDAVCINQDDLDERSHQVRLMKTLYENATKIYVWLGQPQNESIIALAVQKMQDFDTRFLRTMKKARPYRPWWWPVKDQPPDDIANLLMGLSTTDTTVFDVPGTPTHNAWLGIFTLLDVPWWDRTWIYQEATIPEHLAAIFIRGVSVISNSGKISFHYGNFLVTWNQFHTAMLILGHLADIPGHPILTMYSGGYISFHAIGRLRAARSQHKHFSLLEVLQIFRPSQCKDPRDKLYAPLFLASQTAVRSIVPDYNKDVLQVYMDIVNFQLQQKGYEFDFLGHVAQADNRPPLPPRRSSSAVVHWPSWLPDWSIRVSVIPLAKLIYVQRNLEGRSVKLYDNDSTKDHTLYITPAYRASGDLAVAALMEGLKLHVHAVTCDTIHETTDFSYPNSTVDRWRHEGRDVYWTGEPWIKALYHTYAADIRWTNTHLPCARNGVADKEFMSRPSRAMHPRDSAMQRGMNVASNQAEQRRKLCVTKNRSLSLVPDTAVPGDKICMFFGSQVLHVVRTKSDVSEGVVHSYVGEAYVHGLMDGQVPDAVRSGRMHDEMITLV